VNDSLPQPLPAELRDTLRQARADNAAAWTATARPAPLLRQLAHSVDEVLTRLWQDHGLAGASLVAVGGYGRGELFPHSDVDLLILIPDGTTEAMIASPAERLVSALWDIGLDASHSIRTLQECMDGAAGDLTIATSLLEARWVAGPKAPVRRLRQSWFECIDVKDFAQGKLLEMQQRHGRHQDTPYSLEPNCKESPGGLRDLQILRWVTTAFASVSFCVNRDRRRYSRSRSESVAPGADGFGFCTIPPGADDSGKSPFLVG
jgi:[protein-PII] uridylyltransferase